VKIKPAEQQDADHWLDMRCALWPKEARAHLAKDVTDYFTGQALEVAVFIAETEAGRPVGMIELALRPYAEGCEPSPVVYVEGWYVMPEARQRGVGTALIRQAEQWARQSGYTELASDSQLGNEIAYKAHLNAGFEEVEKIVTYRKTLD